jgi:hypothetical protein
MTASKNKAVIRSISIGGCIVLGSALAFLLGVRVGGNLDHRTRSVTIAHTPQSSPVAPAHIATK